MNLPPPADWTKSALCLQIDADSFFPEGEMTQQKYRAAVQFCKSCPVRLQCLDEAMRFEGEDLGRRGRSGVWGGLTPKQRATLASRGAA